MMTLMDISFSTRHLWLVEHQQTKQVQAVNLQNKTPHFNSLPEICLSLQYLHLYPYNASSPNY